MFCLCFSGPSMPTVVDFELITFVHYKKDYKTLYISDTKTGHNLSLMCFWLQDILSYRTCKLFMFNHKLGCDYF